MCFLMAVTVCHWHLESQPWYDEILVVQWVTLTAWSLLHAVPCSSQLAAAHHLGLAWCLHWHRCSLSECPHSVCLGPMMHWPKEITCSTWTFLQKWNASVQVLWPHKDLWRPCRGMQRQKRRSQNTCENSRMSLPKSHLTPSWSRNHGTIPLGWNLGQNPPTARSTHCHPESRWNSMHSSKRISTLEGSAYRNHPWHLRSSLSRRRTAHSSLYRTTEPWMRSQLRTGTQFHSSPNWSCNSMAWDTSPNWMSTGVSTTYGSV